jgi:hypothetical protein
MGANGTNVLSFSKPGFPIHPIATPTRQSINNTTVEGSISTRLDIMVVEWTILLFYPLSKSQNEYDNNYTCRYDE